MLTDMKTGEIQERFSELDSLWESTPSDLDVRLDESGTAIIVNRHTYDYSIDVTADTAVDAAFDLNGPDCEAYCGGGGVPILSGYDAVRISGQMRSPFQSVEPVMKIDLSSLERIDEPIRRRLTLKMDTSRVGFLPDVKLMGIGATGIYQLLEDYSYPVDYFSVGREMPFDVRERYYARADHRNQKPPHLCTITVKEGFQFDRATIPRVFWTLVSKDDLANVAPLFHDLLYRFSGVLHPEWVEPYTEFTRSEADCLFFHMMAKSGVASWRLHIAYQAVCRFSSFAWGKHRASGDLGNDEVF